MLCKYKTSNIKTVKKGTKMKIYLTLTRSVVTYAYEMWTLNEQDKNTLSISERHILRTIFGAVQIRENKWRK